MTHLHRTIRKLGQEEIRQRMGTKAKAKRKKRGPSLPESLHLMSALPRSLEGCPAKNNTAYWIGV